MNAHERSFVRVVRTHFKKNGRGALPWRKTHNPYRILVSEIMLQQTQVDRVVPKYRTFLRQFPSLGALALAPLGEVLKAWQGLGYNRRAKYLQACAQKIVSVHHGKFPRTVHELEALPGIGKYTAGAVLAFAYNIPTPIIETNIRTVFIHHFFHDEVDVDDQEIVRLIVRFLDHKNPREWYYALMDYGAYLKKTYGNPNARSKHYTKQSPFRGSNREIRGATLRALTARAESRLSLHKILSRFDPARIDAELEKLKNESMIIFKEKKYRLP